MGLFQEIHTQARERELDFLVIGGHAVIFHGYSRDTADLDLLIRRKDQSAWLEIFSALGYNIKSERESFIQFSPPKQGAWPVDLMLVEDPTFNPMLEASIEVEMYGPHFKIPTILHLLALKLHALRYGHAERFHKDLLDVEGLVKVNAIDMKAENIRHIFLKHGTLKLYEQISRFTAGQD
jgi:predicted nucleotidyltransferase